MVAKNLRPMSPHCDAAIKWDYSVLAKDVRSYYEASMFTFQRKNEPLQSLMLSVCPCFIATRIQHNNWISRPSLYGAVKHFTCLKQIWWLGGSAPKSVGAVAQSVRLLLRSSWVQFPLWLPVPYWLGRCQHNVTGWDRSHGIPALPRV